MAIHLDVQFAPACTTQAIGQASEYKSVGSRCCVCEGTSMRLRCMKSGDGGVKAANSACIVMFSCGIAQHDTVRKTHSDIQGSQCASITMYCIGKHVCLSSML